ncbi:RNA polymerase subunit sigma [Romboutsia ilealis]|uniref:RNA polymerase sigma factor SigI n=1 Tax=Romboutsia faecis TaxID=2764597 RepID=A0ABR7JMS6_9FIRM|nr:RNA polymerase subunit sigma [Romboutsia faecis]MBC5996212.1 RNA polymerase subunit sigma [Romboutsia faecis]MRN25144.1 RNA polymerase subunit sigma [Romboutsia ilealis]
MSLDEDNLKSTDINILINDNMPFIIKSISKITKKYVSLENDEELSVGILAFNEAVNRYTHDRGPFLPFAQLVIGSRLKNHLQRENRHRNIISIDNLREEGIEVSDVIKDPIEDNQILQNEIRILKDTLYDFGFGLEDLVNNSPKHKETRENAIDLSKRVSQDKPFVSFMYEKKRLPIKKISLKYQVTEKIIKGSKKFIITVIIIFDKKLRNIRLWIKR